MLAAQVPLCELAPPAILLAQYGTVSWRSKATLQRVLGLTIKAGLLTAHRFLDLYAVFSITEEHGLKKDHNFIKDANWWILVCGTLATTLLVALTLSRHRCALRSNRPYGWGIAVIASVLQLAPLVEMVDKLGDGFCWGAIEEEGSGPYSISSLVGGQSSSQSPRQAASQELKGSRYGENLMRGLRKLSIANLPLIILSTSVHSFRLLNVLASLPPARKGFTSIFPIEACALAVGMLCLAMACADVVLYVWVDDAFVRNHKKLVQFHYLVEILCRMPICVLFQVSLYATYLRWPLIILWLSDVAADVLLLMLPTLWGWTRRRLSCRHALSQMSTALIVSQVLFGVNIAFFDPRDAFTVVNIGYYVVKYIEVLVMLKLIRAEICNTDFFWVFCETQGVIMLLSATIVCVVVPWRRRATQANLRLVVTESLPRLSRLLPEHGVRAGSTLPAARSQSRLSMFSIPRPLSECRALSLELGTVAEPPRSLAARRRHLPATAILGADGGAARLELLGDILEGLCLLSQTESSRNRPLLSRTMVTDLLWSLVLPWEGEYDDGAGGIVQLQTLDPERGAVLIRHLRGPNAASERQVRRKQRSIDSEDAKRIPDPPSVLLQELVSSPHAADESNDRSSAAETSVASQSRRSPNCGDSGDSQPQPPLAAAESSAQLACTEEVVKDEEEKKEAINAIDVGTYWLEAGCGEDETEGESQSAGTASELVGDVEESISLVLQGTAIEVMRGTEGRMFGTFDGRRIQFSDRQGTVWTKRGSASSSSSQASRDAALCVTPMAREVLELLLTQLILALRWEPTFLGIGPEGAAVADGSLAAVDASQRPLLCFLLRYALATRDMVFLSEVYWSLWCLSQDPLDASCAVYEKARWVLINTLQGNIEFWDGSRKIRLDFSADSGSSAWEGDQEFRCNALRLLVQQGTLWRHAWKLARFGASVPGDAVERTRAVRQRLGMWKQQALIREASESLSSQPPQPTQVEAEDPYLLGIELGELGAGTASTSLVASSYDAFLSLPIDPSARFHGLDIGGCEILASKTAPLLLSCWKEAQVSFEAAATLADHAASSNQPLSPGMWPPLGFSQPQTPGSWSAPFTSLSQPLTPSGWPNQASSSSQPPTPGLWPSMTHRPRGEVQKYMVKVGDDLRQDQLVIQVLALMEMVWRERLPTAEHEMLRFVPYRVLAMTPRAGFVKFVPGAVSMSKAMYQSHGDLTSWLDAHRPRGLPLAQVLSNLCGSAAAYCVATYVLGIGDRHLDNLQITPEGHFFHIDFGFIFGDDPKPFAPRLRLPQQVANALLGAQADDSSATLLDRCILLAGRAYIALRRSMPLWVSLLRVIGEAGGAGCPRLRAHADAAVVMVRDRLRSDLGSHEEEAAAAEFLLVLCESTEALYPVLTDKVHQLGLFWK